MGFSSSIGVIGGSGFYSLNNEANPLHIEEIKTPYSSTPVSLFGELCGAHKVWFIPRHGKQHSVPPHLINYRANIWALKEAGVQNIIAVNATGGLSSKIAPGQIVIPNQLIDYTWGREHTYFDGLNSLDNHIDFTWPYDRALTALLAQAAAETGFNVIDKAVYACTQGPRLETAAEVIKLKNENCDLVGMTGMPEAALARELELAYACIALSVNWGAGLTDKEISMDEIMQVLESGMSEVRQIINAAIQLLAN